MNKKIIAPFVIAAAALASACGSHESINHYQDGSSGYHKNTGSGSGDQTAQPGDGKRDHVVHPPQEYYDALFANALRLVDAPRGLALLDAAAAQTLWVNFDGASLHKGFELGESFLLCQNQADVPAADVSPADKDAIVARVQKFFADAGSNLNVTADLPASGSFTTMHVGGSFKDLGCGGTGVLGIAPFDQGNANKADIGFAFTKGITSVQTIAETIAHEAGHTFGLDHTSDMKDLMFASSTDQITGFLAAKLATGGATQDGPALLQKALGLLDGAVAAVGAAAGSGSATTPVAIPGIAFLPISLANLPGLSQISMIGQLLASLKGGSVADISALIPQIIALLPIDAKAIDLSGLDKILTVVGVAASAQASQTGQPLPTTLNGILNSSLLQGLLAPSGAGAITGLAGLAGLAGFGNIGTAVTAITGILGAFTPPPAAAGATTPATTTSAAAAAIAAQLPDFGAILGLATKDKNISALITNLLGTAEIISKNFNGPDKEALLSLIKVAYSQLYAQLAMLPATAP